MTAVPVPTTLAPPQSPTGLRRLVADSRVLVWRYLIQLPRIPEIVVFALIQPIMFVLLFTYVFGGAIKVPGVSYVNFLMPGIFVQTAAFGSIATGIGLAEDLHKGLIDRFRSLPMAPGAVLVGRTLADLVRNIAVLIVMFVVGLLVGFRPQGSALGWLAAFLLMIVFMFSFSWIAATIGLSVRTVETAQTAGFIWLFPLTFASAVFVPVSTMPGWLQAFAAHNPITKMAEAERALLVTGDVGGDGWIAFAWCLAILAVFMPLGIRAYRRATTR